MTIGPHQGKELGLMLAGEKKLATFGDIIPPDGDINETIIPEKAFAPHVFAEQVVRIEKTFPSGDGKLYKSVCFTLPGEEWRAHFYNWYSERLFSKEHIYSASDEFIIGALLGYTRDDIEHFVANMQNRKN